MIQDVDSYDWIVVGAGFTDTFLADRLACIRSEQGNRMAALGMDL